jgi:hypothetical protein
MNLSVAVSILPESGLKKKLNSILKLLNFPWRLDIPSAELLLETSGLAHNKHVHSAVSWGNKYQYYRVDYQW